MQHSTPSDDIQINIAFYSALRHGDLATAEAALKAGASPRHPIVIKKSGGRDDDHEFAIKTGIPFSKFTVDKANQELAENGLSETLWEDDLIPAIPSIFGVLNAPLETKEVLLDLAKNYVSDASDLANPLNDPGSSHRDLFEECIRQGDAVVLDWLVKNGVKPSQNRIDQYQQTFHKHVAIPSFGHFAYWMHDQGFLPKPESNPGWWFSFFLSNAMSWAKSEAHEIVDPFFEFIDRVYPASDNDFPPEHAWSFFNQAVLSPHDSVFIWGIARFAKSAAEFGKASPMQKDLMEYPIRQLWNHAKTFSGYAQKMPMLDRRIERLKEAGFKDDVEARMLYSITDADAVSVRHLWNAVNWHRLDAIAKDVEYNSQGGVQGLFSMSSIAVRDYRNDPWISCVADILSALKQNGLPAGSQPSALDNQKPAFHFAVVDSLKRSAEFKSDEMVFLSRFLLGYMKNVDDINIQDSKGNTVLHAIENWSQKTTDPEFSKRSSEYVEKLIENGASPWIANHKGLLPMDLVSVRHREAKSLSKEAESVRSLQKKSKPDHAPAVTPQTADFLEKEVPEPVARDDIPVKSRQTYGLKRKV